MPLSPGSRIGPYEVLAPVGAGGMGEVYRARDSKLNRDVAIKVLPPAFAQDAERLRRFEREAQMLAALNHPNIAAIYGLEGNALVMELVEGATLRGPLPVDDALGIAMQIAEGLEYAHEKGIIHRDLKPANIKVTPEGQVKLLDFGLAKAMAEDPKDRYLADSPTMSLAATKMGVILGTAGYMSPEQAKGGPVDKRADIWAFGALLFELLAGKRLIDEPTASEALAAVLRSDLDMVALPAATPPRIRRLIERCLKRDPKRRLRDIGEARIALETTEDAPPPGFGSAAPQSEPIRRVHINLDTDAMLASNGRALALSPDGGILAYVDTGGNRRLLYLRRLDQLKATPLTGTDEARSPFFSPDSQWIGFFADGKLKKVSIHGGAVVTVCDAPRDYGGTWAADGTILFGTQALSGLRRVSDEGGTPQIATTPDNGEVTHRWPQLLPGDKAVMFTANMTGSSFDLAQIDVQVLGTGQKKTVQRGGYHGRYLPSGHLIYIHKGTLFAAGFDVNRLETTTPPMPIIEGVSSNFSGGASQFDFTLDGSLVYQPGSGQGGDYSIYWMSAGGKIKILRSAPGDYSQIQFSPDGRRLAIQLYDGRQSDVWILDCERDAMTRLTFEGGQFPAWTGDGCRIAFVPFGSQNIYWRRADGAGEVQQLTRSGNGQLHLSWHPSGKFLAFVESNPKNSNEIMILPMEGDEASGWNPGQPNAFLNTPFQEVTPAFSPDGNWLAYASNESGGEEVYVRPFPGPGGRSQVSTTGGTHPTWSRNGKEMFYRAADNRIMTVNYTVKGDSFQVDKPRPFAQTKMTFTNSTRGFDLHPDGKRFAVLRAPQQGEEEEKRDMVVLITNFFEELRRVTKNKNRHGLG